eukprot:10000710-Alexandrium_andersonii.AAC.1
MVGLPEGAAHTHMCCAHGCTRMGLPANMFSLACVRPSVMRHQTRYWHAVWPCRGWSIEVKHVVARMPSSNAQRAMPKQVCADCGVFDGSWSVQAVFGAEWGGFI